MKLSACLLFSILCAPPPPPPWSHRGKPKKEGNNSKTRAIVQTVAGLLQAQVALLAAWSNLKTASPNFLAKKIVKRGMNKKKQSYEDTRALLIHAQSQTKSQAWKVVHYLWWWCPSVHTYVRTYKTKQNKPMKELNHFFS